MWCIRNKILASMIVLENISTLDWLDSNKRRIPTWNKLTSLLVKDEQEQKNALGKHLCRKINTPGALVRNVIV
jgi:hypothetical protein